MAIPLWIPETAAIGPLLTGITLGISTSLVAWRQWITAKEQKILAHKKLTSELFDRRFEVYEFLYNIYENCLSGILPASEILRKEKNYLHKSRFLFDEEDFVRFLRLSQLSEEYRCSEGKGFITNPKKTTYRVLPHGIPQGEEQKIFIELLNDLDESMNKYLLLDHEISIDNKRRITPEGIPQSAQATSGEG